jgi:hypothetical protein
MEEIIESEMNMDVCGTVVIKTKSVTDDGQDTIEGTVFIG